MTLLKQQTQDFKEPERNAPNPVKEINLNLSGRVDRVYYNDEIALVIDWKSGFTEPTEAENNSQLKVLAVLVALRLPTVKEVIVQIVSGPYGVTEARYDMPALAIAYDDVVATLRKLYDPQAPLNPSPEACKHCSAIMICPALQKEVYEPLTKVQITELPEGGVEAAWLLDKMEIMGRLCKQIKDFYKDKFESDPTYKIPGYELVPGNVLRDVTDWDAARARLSEYLPVAQLNAAADYRLGELEKALGKVVRLKGTALRERMNTILQGLYVEKQNAGSIKRTKNN